MNTATARTTHIRIDDTPLDHASEQYTREIAGLDGVEEVFILPDAFTKEKYVGLDYKITIPSSSVIVTDVDTLYPQFRTRGINCGMMALALPFTKDELSDALLRDILHALTYDPLYYLAVRLRLPLFADQYDLSYDDFLGVIQEGVPYLLERYKSNESDISEMDFRGSYDRVDLNASRELLNERWLTRRTVRMRQALGRYFGGNHFFELQSVAADAPELGLTKGHVVALLHTGCQGLEAVVRPDLAEAHIHQKTYQKVTRGNEMYDAFFAAQSLLMNLGFAYRFTTYALLNDVLAAHGRDRSTILADKSHNYVHREAHKGADKLVYRHNAERLKSGGRAIVSGRFDAPSYIVRGGERIGDIYNTIDHGLGRIIEGHEGTHMHTDRLIHGETTLHRYKYGVRAFAKSPHSVPHIPPTAAEAYFSTMEGKGYAAPIATLVPFMNLKYTK